MGATRTGEHGATVNKLLRGDLDVSAARSLYDDLTRLAHDDSVSTVCLDFTGVDDVDSAGVAVVAVGRRALEVSGKQLELRNLSAEHRAAFDLRAPLEAEEGDEETKRRRRKRQGVLDRIGAAGRASLHTLVDLAELAVDNARSLGRCIVGRERMPWRSIVEQSVVIGVDALPIVALLSFLIGVILTFQSVSQLALFGAEIYTADLVALGIIREFGAFITAIILAGRSGAAIAAELGTMTVNEEVDALRTMGISPVRYLVLPRLVAITIVTPALTLMSMVIGIAAGLLISPLLDLSWLALYRRMVWITGMSDLNLGMTKSVLFAWAIGFSGCFLGLRTRGGATSVGTAATRAVVAAIFFIVVIDSIVTTAWTLGHYD